MMKGKELITTVEKYRSELSERVSVTIGKYSSKIQAAEAANISTEQLNKWAAGTVKIPAEGLWRLANGAGIDFGWLIAGGSATQINASTLRDVLFSLGQVMETGVVFEAEKFPALVLALHDFMMAERDRLGGLADISAAQGLISLAARQAPKS